MACSACAKRRKKLQALKAEKKAKRQGIQAAAIGAVLSVTETVGNAIGIHGEVEDGDGSGVRTSDSGADSGLD